MTTNRRKATETDIDLPSLIDQFAFCKTTDDLPALRNEILSRIPAAVESYRSIADPGAVDAVFESLRQKLDEGLSQDRNTRSIAIRTPLGRIAQWEQTVAGIDRLRQLMKADGDAITTFIRFANTAFHLADDVLAWFPDPDSTGRETGWATAPERESLAQIVSPGGVIAFHDTLYARAVASARERGEPAFALPKLERIQKGLSRLGQLLRDGSATSLIGTDVGQELSEAICDAFVLVDNTPTQGQPTSALEAIQQNRSPWATVNQLVPLLGWKQSKSALRSRLLNLRNSSLAPRLHPGDVHPVNPRNPDGEKTYSIMAVWKALFPKSTDD